MICIIKQRLDGGAIDGWIIATDLADATRQAYGAGEHELADMLYRADGSLVPAGKHRLLAGDESEYWLLA